MNGMISSVVERRVCESVEESAMPFSESVDSVGEGFGSSDTGSLSVGAGRA